MTIGTKISKLRDIHKLSQPELAYKLNISQASLSEIESGKTKKIDFLLMDKVCKTFEVDFEYFLENATTNNNVKKAENCNIGCANGTINNNVPEGILENMLKRIELLENKMKQ